MQNIQKLYQDLHEGKISRNQFLFQLRKDSRINSFFTSANSYDETVRILKNRGLLFEKHLTPAETKKKESIITSMKDTFKGPAPAMYAIATKKAEKLAEDNLDEDYEVSMAEDSLDSIIQAAMKLKSELGGQEVNLPAWVQDHITNSENYINQAAKGYHEADAEMENHAGEENESMYEARFKKGEDVGEKGMNFKKIQKDAAKRYGSEEAGKRVAGSILKKVLKKEEIGSNDPETSYEGLNNINEAKNNPKVEKLVNVINDMIAKAMDEDGDPIGVIEPGTTYEEPYTYFPIEYKNGTLRITSKSVYNNKPEVDVISSENMMYDGVPTLQLIARMYKKAIKKSGNNQEMPPAPSQEETDANQVYEGNLNESKEPTKGADQVNPYELEKGTYYELDCQKDGAKDTKKAKAKAIKNLNKNPKYYSDLFSKNYNDNPNTSDQMQIVKESLKNLINDILSEK